MKYFSKELAMTGAANLIILAGILSIPVALEVHRDASRSAMVTPFLDHSIHFPIMFGIIL